MCDTTDSKSSLWKPRLYLEQPDLPPAGWSANVGLDFWVEAINNIGDKMETLATINPVLYGRLEIDLSSVDDALAALETMRKGVRWDPVSNTIVWKQISKT